MGLRASVSASAEGLRLGSFLTRQNAQPPHQGSRASVVNGTAKKCLRVEVRRVGTLTKETDMHAEDTIRPGNLT